MNTFDKDLETFAKKTFKANGAPPRKPNGASSGGGIPPNVLGFLCQNAAKKACPRGVGKGAGLMGSIRNEMHINKRGWVVIVGTNQKYAEGVEMGTKPHYVPPEDLELWCRRKLNLSASEARSASYAVSNKISKEGTKAQPFLLPGCIAGFKKWKSRYGR